MAISGDDVAQIAARCGVARCGTFRCGCAPNDILADADGVSGAIDHTEPALYAASEGTVLEWGLGGVTGGVDELAGGD